MSTTIEQVSEKIAAEIISFAQNILNNNSISANPKSRVNTLRKSALSHTIKSNVRVLASGNIIIDTLFGNYLRYIEQGRPPRRGKMPPISTLRDWALKNNIPTDNNTLWAISYAIWRDGYAGRPILSTLEKEIEKRWENHWSEELFNSLANELKNYFKP